MKREQIEVLKTYMPPEYSELFDGCEGELINEAEEIRFRTDGGVRLYTWRGNRELASVKLKSEDLKRFIQALTHQSPYYYERELSRGYYTLHGLRIGVAGGYDPQGRLDMNAIRGLNIRIPSAHTGVATELMRHSAFSRLRNTLIFSPPCMGKTTLVRDIARILSDGETGEAMKVALIDERGELYGDGGFYVGGQTDVIYGKEKSSAMELALRSLSPQVIVTDEIGGARDADAIRAATNSGVSVIATAHAATMEEIEMRFSDVVAAGAFERYVLLGDGLGRVTVTQIYGGDKTAMLEYPLKLSAREC